MQRQPWKYTKWLHTKTEEKKIWPKIYNEESNVPASRQDNSSIGRICRYCKFKICFWSLRIFLFSKNDCDFLSFLRACLIFSNYNLYKIFYVWWMFKFYITFLHGCLLSANKKSCMKKKNSAAGMKININIVPLQ